MKFAVVLALILLSALTLLTQVRAADVQTDDQRIASVMQRLGVYADVVIVDQPEINAWTTERGKIFITRSLFNYCQSDDELASVLAHEVGHGTCGHFEKREAKRQAVEMVINNAILSSPQESKLILQVGKVEMAAIPVFSKGDEFEADNWGFGALVRTNFNPDGMVSLFERLKNDKGDVSGLLKLLSTHPPFKDRIARLRRSEQLLPVYDDLIATTEEIDPKPFSDMVAGTAMPGYVSCPIGKKDSGLFLFYKSDEAAKVAKGKVVLPKGVENIVILSQFDLPPKRTLNSFTVKIGEAQISQIPLNGEALSPLAIRVRVADLVACGGISYERSLGGGSIFSAKKSSGSIDVESADQPATVKAKLPPELTGIGRVSIWHPIRDL